MKRDNHSTTLAQRRHSFEESLLIAHVIGAQDTQNKKAKLRAKKYGKTKL